MRLQNWSLLGLSTVRSSYSQAGTPGCEPLDSFLGQFGNQWDTDCVDIYNNGTGVEQPRGTACYAQCKENQNEQYLYCSCNHDNCFWVPNDIYMDQADWQAQTLGVHLKSKYGHMVESFYDEDEWGVLWRVRFLTNKDLNWGWALRMTTNQDLSAINVDSYSLHLQYKLQYELLFQNRPSNQKFDKSYHEAYIHFSGYNLDDFSRFESNLEFTLEYFEINPLGKITNDLLNKFSSCNSFDYNMQNDAYGPFQLKFDYEEEPAEYEYEPEYEEYEGTTQNRPNIVLVTLSEIGMGDVSWLNEFIQMPNVELLLSEGIVLTNSYSHVSDTQSRASLFTGKYAWNLGLTSEVPNYDESAFILEESAYGMAQFLKSQGYSTALVGMWGLGFCSRDHTPEMRGFNEFYGSYGSNIDGFSFERDGIIDNNQVDFENGTFTQDYFGQRALEFIKNVEYSEDPFFLQVNFNGNKPLTVAENYMKLFPDHIPFNRRIFMARLLSIDVQIGKIVNSLKNRQMWDNTVLVLQTLTGADDSLSGGGSNWPYRGRSGDPTEGGTKVPTAIISPLLKEKGLYQNLFHISDWFPTIADLVNPNFPFRGDGVSHKRALFNLNDHSPRQNMVYDVTSTHVVLRQENLKFYFNMELGISPSDWSPPPEGKHGFHLEALFKLYENRATQNIDNGLQIGGRTVYLFDLLHDPLELINIANVLPEKISELRHQAVGLLEHVAFNDSGENLYKYGLNLAKQMGRWEPGWCNTAASSNGMLMDATMGGGFEVPEFEIEEVTEKAFIPCESLIDNTRYQFPRTEDFSMECTEEYCNFSCGPNKLPNVPHAQCVDGKWKPRRALVKCKPIVKLFDITTCSNLIYEEYSTSKDEIDVACNHNVCGVKCKNGAESVYVDDLGIRESRSLFTCKHNTVWHPNNGRIVCEN